MSEEAQTGDAPAAASRPPSPGHANGSNGANGVPASPQGRHARPEPRKPAAGPGSDEDDGDPADGYPAQFEQRFQHLVDATDPQPDRAAGADADAEAATAVAVDDPVPVVDRRTERHRGLIRSAVIIAIVVLAAAVLRFFVVGHYYIPSASMEPTLHGCPGCNDDHVLVDKLSYRAHSPRPGDVVVFDRPPADTSGEAELIKRVIATGGDDVALRDGHVYVNGLLLDEPYINKRCGSHPTSALSGVSRWTIPSGDVFVLGDNRCNSWDSRAFGPVKDSSVVGRAFAIVWPLKRARLL